MMTSHPAREVFFKQKGQALMGKILLLNTLVPLRAYALFAQLPSLALFFFGVPFLLFLHPLPHQPVYTIIFPRQ